MAGKLPADVRLPPNFKTFDFYDVETKVATSAKTLDTTTAAKVANPSQVYYSLKGNVDAVAKFDQPVTLSGATVDPTKILQRVVQVAIPTGTTPAQWDQIVKAIQYGQSRNVIIKITVVKP
jgi:filamentous hemagglutinin